MVFVGYYGAKGWRVLSELVVQAAAYLELDVFAVSDTERTHPAQASSCSCCVSDYFCFVVVEGLYFLQVFGSLVFVKRRGLAQHNAFSFCFVNLFKLGE